MKKNILFVVDNLKMGGVTKVLSNLLKKLSKNEYNIELLVLHYYEDMKIEIPEDVKIIQGGKAFSSVDENISKLLKEKNIKKIIKKILFSLAIKTGFIANIIKRDKMRNNIKNYDVEIAFGDGFPYFYTAYGNSKKKISWMHSDVIIKDYSARYYKQMKKALAMFQTYIAVSDKVAQSYEERYDVKNVKVIHNIIDEEEILNKSKISLELPFNKEDLNFLSVGRLDYSKNYDMLIRVSKKLLDEGYKFKVYIIGEGEERAKLEKSILDLDIQDKFILLGRKENPYPYMKAADVFLLSSRYEGLPTVIIESLILHVPCISTRVAGIEQILNESFGVVAENNEQDFYIKLKELLDDSFKIKEMKKNLLDYKYDNNNINLVKEVLN